MINKFYSLVRIVFRKIVNRNLYLKVILNILYLLGGIVDLLIGMDCVDVFIDMYFIFGNVGEFIVKINCFG